MPGTARPAPAPAPLRLLAVTPIHVGEAERQRRAARYARLAPPGVEVGVCDLGPEAPRALEAPGDVELSTRLVERAVAAGLPEGADAFLPDCVLDPAVPARTAAPAGQNGVRVHGILRTCAGWLWGAGRRFGGIARNPAIAAELYRKITAYGLADAYVGTEILDLDVAAISDESRWNRAMDAALERLARLGADAALNGCSAVDITTAKAPLDVIDPTALALRAIDLRSDTAASLRS